MLAAGIGSRLRPLTGLLPKCLMPVNGRPLLEYWLSSLTAAGVGPFLINTFHHAELVQDWLNRCQYVDRVKITSEKKLLGTAGTLLANSDFIDDNPVMLIHGDNLSVFDATSFLRAHRQRPAGTEITMMTFIASQPEQCGILELDDIGIVRGFHEKVTHPPGNLANGAVYIVEPGVIDFLASLKKNTIDFSTEVLPHYLGRIYTYHNSIYHRDIGTIESLLAAQVEYPHSVQIPSVTDSWHKFCKQYVFNGENGLVRLLAKAMQAIFVENDYELEHIIDNKELATSKFIVQVTKDQVNLNKIINLIQRSGLPKANVFLYFSNVQKGFSSYEIYKQHNLKSLAICATD